MLTSLCYSRWGHRPVTILGAVLSAAGLLGAAVYIHLSLAPSILVLYVCVGLVTGLGFGLMYLPAWDIIEVKAVNEISQYYSLPKVYGACVELKASRNCFREIDTSN